jgi:DNA polymerase-3 subunit beta
MKAVCATKDLFQGIQTASRAIGGKSAWPILNNILIRTESDHLKLTAFDLELGIECTVPATIEEEGALTIPARLAGEVLSTFPESEVSISVDELNSVNLKCEKSDYTLLGLPPEEFHPLPEIPDNRSFQIPQAVLKDMIKQTIFAVSTDESRVILTGILLVLNGEQIKLVSTDTNRLTVRSSTVANACGEATCIVPRRAMDEVSRLLEDDESLVSVSIADSQIKFVINGVTVISRLIEGQFPNYERVIPSEYTRKLTIPTEEFLSKVRRASIVAREDANRVILKVQGDTLIITAESGDVGKAYEELEIVREGEDIEIAFNAKFLTDFLNVVGEDGIFMELTEPLRQGVMKPVGKDDYIYVLMPMQIL